MSMPRWQIKVKQTTDYVISFVSLILLSPVILILVFLIKCSGKGPVVFTQERVGKNGKPFIIYKFRSMCHNAENGQPLLSNPNDSRVTTIGRFMRKHRLDEIPNFINVLKGEMSLVGPRPERQFFIEQVIQVAPEYNRLFTITPGITGWGQVKYGYTSSVDEMSRKLEYDLYYLENMSLYFDLRIIVFTLLIIIRGKGM